jgi:catechol 2,3-dioxygenase-like lactoylglutathione lyase family enzyme
MAKVKSRKTARSKSKPRKAPARRPRRAPRAAARKGPAPRKIQKRSDPETLRLRSMEPSLTVSDLETSIRFYTDVLGFIVGERWVRDGVLRGVMLKAGACELALSQDDWAKGRDRKKGVGMRLWCSTAQDVDALAARIRAAGGTIAEGPRDESWGARSLAVVDPDGFSLTIYREA